MNYIYVNMSAITLFDTLINTFKLYSLILVHWHTMVLSILGHMGIDYYLYTYVHYNRWDKY